MMEIDHEISADNDTNQNVVNYVKDISTTSVSKQKYVDSLKYDYEKVQLEVQKKMEELKKIKESNSNFQCYINSHKFMMDELQKTEEAESKEISVNRETAQNLRDEMAKLKLIKNEDLASYEDKVANMTNKFIEGPFSCNPTLLSGKMKKLLEIRADVRKELVSIQNDLEIIHKRFNLAQAPSGVAHLQTLQETAEENEVLKPQIEEINNEVQSLEKVASGLEQELKVLRKQRRTNN